MFDYYQCRFPQCGYKEEDYFRVCPMCKREKSADLVIDGRLRDTLINLVMMTTKVDLEIASGTGRYGVTHFDLTRFLLQEIRR